MIINDISKLEEMPIGRSQDLTKMSFIGFKALKRVKPYTKSRNAHWLCLCDCGNYFVSTSNHLISGSCISCGCAQKKVAKENISKFQKESKGKPKVNYEGVKIGKLTVKNFSHIDKNRHSVWNCECECGGKTQTTSSDISKKDVKSCGCLKQSYGSYLIEQVLIQNKITFEKEKSFNSCRFPDTNALAKFDFWIDDKILLEFDGKQHYEFVGGYFSLNDFHNLQKRDAYKDEWCLKNNIKLVRISYLDEEKINIDYLKEKIYG